MNEKEIELLTNPPTVKTATEALEAYRTKAKREQTMKIKIVRNPSRHLNLPEEYVEGYRTSVSDEEGEKLIKLGVAEVDTDKDVKAVPNPRATLNAPAKSPEIK